jgi:methylated-DNA-protein-cysteine methyltransferase related protein
LKKNKQSTDFYNKVYKVVREIPYGRVTSYGSIAKHIGSPQASRMVGWALNVSHSVEPPVPAHRVVNRNGMLTGKHHFSGAYVMEDLLKSEGVEVVNNKVINFKKKYWEP